MPGDNRTVYSTDGGWLVPQAQVTGEAPRKGKARPADHAAAKFERDPKDGTLRIHRDKAGRGGKTVTVVTGFSIPQGQTEIEELAQTLKRYCGSGGNVVDGRIEIQGDHRERLAKRLGELGYRVKLAGG